MKPGTGRSADTTTPVATTRTQIEELLTRYGATGFVSGWQDTPEGKVASIQFELADRRFRIPVKMPNPSDRSISHVHKGARGIQPRTAAERKQALEKHERQAWRNIYDLLIAVLILVDRGHFTPQEILTRFVVLPAGCTVGQWLDPQLEAVYTTGKMPALMPGVLE